MPRTEADIQADIDALTAALAAPESEVRVGNRSVRFRSVEEIRAAIEGFRAELAAAQSTRPARQFRVRMADKGL